jgi:cation diffusion facilitator family transporter
MEPSLTRYAWLSIAAALATIALKTAAWWLTGSVGLLSDALESLVNLAGALMALWMLTLAAQPADEQHHFGHSKAEYFSSAFEGLLILVAATAIAVAAIERLRDPQPLDQVGIGLAVSVVASLINLGVGRALIAVGKRHHSIALEADGHHLMTDVWTSVGVIGAVALVAWTGWLWLDPVIALVVAANIVWTGVRLMRRSAAGLMDSALPADQLRAVETALLPFRARGIDYHALRTRQAGARQFLSIHLLVPGNWTVQQGHDLAEEVESAIGAQLPHANVTTHIEPIEDARAHEDITLDRKAAV